MQTPHTEAELEKTNRKIKTIEQDWREFDASTRALVRPKLLDLRKQRQRLIEKILRR